MQFNYRLSASLTKLPASPIRAYQRDPARSAEALRLALVESITREATGAYRGG